MNANKTVAHRLGRVLEKVTQQSGRLSGTPEYGSWLLGNVSENQARRRIRIQVILTVVHPRRERRSASSSRSLLVTVVIPVPSIFSDAPLWITFAVRPGLHRTGAGARRLLDHPPDGQRVAVGHRGAQADARGSAQHLPGAVAGGEGASDPVGRRRGPADDPVRVAEHRVHPTVPVLRRVPRRCRGDGLLPDHRVRAAAGGRTGAGGRAPAAPVHRGNHGPDDDRVVSRLGVPWSASCSPAVVHAVAA